MLSKDLPSRVGAATCTEMRILIRGDVVGSCQGYLVCGEVLGRLQRDDEEFPDLACGDLLWA